MLFHDRQDAGLQLAERLTTLSNAQPPPVVLGLPRGGVVVAAEIARILHAPLDVLVVCKIGAPLQPELAIGAVTDGDKPRVVLNNQLISGLGVDEEYLQAEIMQQYQEVKRREDYFRHGRLPVDVEGRMVIAVDDGIATGATVRAGIAALKQKNTSRLVLAVPVAAPDSLRMLEQEVDEIYCLAAPPDFMAVGRYYENFEQTTDEEVVRLLDEAARSNNHLA